MIEDLKTKGYALLPRVLEQHAAAHAISAFMEFLKCDAKKDFSQYLGNGLYGTFGYGKRDLPGDHREFFYYNPSINKVFPDLEKSNDPRISAFLNAAHEIYQLSLTASRRILKRLELFEPGIQRLFFDVDTPELYVRFLSYMKQDVDMSLFSGHYDKSALTLLLAESGAGFYIGTKEHQEPLDLKEHSLLHAGLTFNDQTNALKILPAWHGVSQQNLPEVFPGVVRWSIVCFLGYAHARKIAPGETRTYKE